MSGDKDEIEPIQKVKAAWQAAMVAADVRGLGELMTEDVVVIHGDGQATVGRAAVQSEFSVLFRQFSVDQTATSEETVIAGDWAYDLGRVVTTLVPVGGGEPFEVRTKAIMILRRVPDGSWLIARTMGVVEEPDAA